MKPRAKPTQDTITKKKRKSTGENRKEKPKPTAGKIVYSARETGAGKPWSTGKK